MEFTGVGAGVCSVTMKEGPGVPMVFTIVGMGVGRPGNGVGGRVLLVPAEARVIALRAMIDFIVYIVDLLYDCGVSGCGCV